MEEPPKCTDENTGSLRLALVTSNGSPLNENVEIQLHNQIVADNRTVHALASQPLLIHNLLAFPRSIYQVQIVPEKSEPESRLANIFRDQTTDLCIVFHDKGKQPPPPDTCFQIPDV